MDEFPSFDSDGEDQPLFDAIKNENLIIFFGAGASKLAGCAGWVELAEEVVNCFPEKIYSHLDKVVLKEIAAVDPRKTISICFHKAKEVDLMDKYFKVLRKAVRPRDKEKFQRVHDKIFNLKAISYVTTNIDRGIEGVNDSTSLQRKEIIDLTKPSFYFDPKDKVRNGNIFYLHGCLKNIRNTVFTVDSYHEHYFGEDGKIVDAFLKEIFGKNHVVLFIGYGLEEYEILHNIFLALNDQKNNVENYRYFVLTPIFSRDQVKFNLESNYLKLFSIKAIPYVIDKNGYEGLIDVLDSFHKKVQEFSPETIQIHNAIDEM